MLGWRKGWVRLFDGFGRLVGGWYGGFETLAHSVVTRVAVRFLGFVLEGTLIRPWELSER